MNESKVQRRRTERRSGLWSGRYQAGRARRWVDCRVIDLSPAGAAIEVDDRSRETLSRGRLRLEVRPVGDTPDRVAVRAEVRNASRLPDRRWRLGIEFIGLDEQAQATLRRMLDRYST